MYTNRSEINHNVPQNMNEKDKQQNKDYNSKQLTEFDTLKKRNYHKDDLPNYPLAYTHKPIVSDLQQCSSQLR